MNSQLVDNISNTVLNNFVDSDKYSAVGGLSASLVANESKNTNVYRVLKMSYRPVVNLHLQLHLSLIQVYHLFCRFSRILLKKGLRAGS